MKELNLSFLLNVFKKHWWKIVAITLLVMLGATLITQFFVPKKYSSSVKFYVVNVNTDLDYTSASYLSAAEYLVNDYIEIIKSDALPQKISEKLKEEGYAVSASSVRGMISSSAKVGTSVFTVTVSHTDKKLAYRVAQLLEEIGPEEVTKIAKPSDTAGLRAAKNAQVVLQKLKEDGAFDDEIPPLDKIEEFVRLNGEQIERLDCIAVIKSPVEATSHDSPNVILNTLLSGIVAAILSFSLFLVISSIASTVVSEDDAKVMLKKPVMSAIPHWETTPKK